MTCLVNADFLVNDSAVLQLTAGDVVRCGRSDAVWPGWVWATHEATDRRGYVPDDILEKVDSEKSRVLRDFDGAELSVRRSETVEVLRQVHGWHWCRQADGREGWVAGYLLRPV